jgi:soluble lytic murein transglycosylase-like protein
MRLSAAIFLTALLSLFAADARAQEARARYNAAAATSAPASRSPRLVIHESASMQGLSGAATAPAGAQDAAAKPLEGAAATAAAAEGDTAPAPMVLSGARPAAPPAAHTVETTGNPRYDKLVMEAAARHGVDPNLVFAVMRQESGFNARARSYKGASGLMQLMPATARRFGVTNIWDPAQNIDAGTRYLRFLLDTFNGDVKLALAGYNAGEGAVVKYGYTVPRYRETQNYVRSISARYGRATHNAARAVQAAASSEPLAPAAMTFSGGTSSRLSNNY